MSQAQDAFGAGLALGMVLGSCGACIFTLIVAGTDRGGQIKGLENRWTVQRIEAADGSVKYIDLDKPTSRPVR